MGVGNGDAGGREALGVGEADALKGVVDNDDAEAGAAGTGAEERALDEVMAGVGDDDVAVGYEGGGGVDNDDIGEGDALMDVGVDGVAELALGVGVG